MKKALALLLALVTLLPLAIGCADNNEPDPAESTGIAQTTSGVTETEDPFDDKVPEFDFEERSFVIVGPTPKGDIFFDREEETSEVVNDAIYGRNRRLEQRFNITISALMIGTTGTMAQELAPYMMAQEDVIDLFGVGVYQSGIPLITAGYAVPWNTVPYINLDKPWWNKSVTETLGVLGNYYYLSGDINHESYNKSMAYYFNKVVASRFETVVGNLYDTVDAGDWTEEKLYNLSKDLSIDNGDSVWDQNDTYGNLQDINALPSHIYGSNYETVFMDKDGAHLNFNTDKMNQIVNNAYNLICENNITFMSADKDQLAAIFFDNRALFLNVEIGQAEKWRGFDTDFGILPLPKFDKEQKDYVSYSDQWGLVLGLPCTASNYERTGAILEAMACLSRQLTVPALYEKTLLGKVKRDDESEAMLDIIFSNLLYDTGICFVTDLSMIPLRTLMQVKSNSITSWYRANQKRLQKNYDSLYNYVKAQVEAQQE